MNRIILVLICIVISSVVPLSLRSEEFRNRVILNKVTINTENGYSETPAPGHRMPPRPIVGIINVSAGMIDYSADLGEDVEVYEVWNVDGSAVLASFVDEAEFVDFLALNADRELQIRITLTSYALIGYIY